MVSFDALPPSLHAGAGELADLPRARQWRELAQAVHELPPLWPRRARRWLLEYADRGNAQAASRAVGVDVRTGWRYLKRFRTWRMEEAAI